MPDAEIYMATDTFIDFSTGAPVRVNVHATARAGHRIIAANPTMWVPLQVDYEVTQSSADVQSGTLEGLRSRAEALGVKVDRRWSEGRLQQEIDAAQDTSRG